MHAIYRPAISGRDDVPVSGGVVRAGNHLSFIDSLAIPLAGPRRPACASWPRRSM